MLPRLDECLNRALPIEEILAMALLLDAISNRSEKGTERMVKHAYPWGRNDCGLKY